MSALRAWLASPAGMAYSKDVVLSDDAARPISMSRIGATYDPESVVTSEQMVAGMRGLREEVAAVAAGAFPFTYQYMFWEQFGVVAVEASMIEAPWWGLVRKHVEGLKRLTQLVTRSPNAAGRPA